MKNKLLTIAITAALTSLSSGVVTADDNLMVVTQENSVGTVDATQGIADGDTNNSSIMIKQSGAVAGTAITVTQTNAEGVHADIIQYQSAEEASSTITINQSGGTETDGNRAYISQGATMDLEGAVVGGMNAGNNLTVNHQSGSGNTIAGYGPQEEMMSGYATQTGSSNEAILNQDGINNGIGFSQNGTQNVAVLTQSAGSSDSSIHLLQNGDANDTTVNQGGEGIINSHIDINIVGNENNLGGEDYSVNQLSSDSNIAIQINGDLNRASVSQSAEASGSSIALIQDGNENMATLAQNGTGNQMDLLQVGDNNLATMTQNGHNDTMHVEQYGGSVATLTQN